jgi:hypothetical protein
MLEYNTGTFANADVDALEDVAIIQTRGKEILIVTFTVGVATLTNFDVQARPSTDAPYVNVADATADYTTPKFPVLKASSDLNVAAAGDHNLILDVRGQESVKLRAAGTSSTITGFWSAE